MSTGFTYTLYDKDDLPVLTTNGLEDIAKYLGRQGTEYLRVQIWKFFSKQKQGKNPELIASDGKRYTIYRFKEQDYK